MEQTSRPHTGKDYAFTVRVVLLGHDSRSSIGLVEFTPEGVKILAQEYMASKGESVGVALVCSFSVRFQQAAGISRIFQATLLASKVTYLSAMLVELPKKLLTHDRQIYCSSSGVGYDEVVKIGLTE